ncbi:hypothetical protein [Streptomyces sp. NPDC004376]
MKILITGETEPDHIDVTGNQPATVIEVDTAINVGSVASVNGQTGVVVLDAVSVGADPAGAADSKLSKTANLSDLGSVNTARMNLGLGAAAVLNVGTTAGTVAAGDDSRIAGAAQKASNLSDLANAATARTNLGLGGAAALNVGTGVGTVAAGNDSRFTDARTPTAHAASHGSGGSDAVTVAQSQVTGLAAALAALLPLSGGTLTGPLSGTTFTGSGTSQVNNLRMGANGGFGSGNGGLLAFQNATTVPTTNPSQGAIMYADSGVMKVRQADGTIVTVANGVSQATADSTYTSIAAYGNVWTPSDHGLTAWSFDPAACTTTGTTLSSGYIYLIEIILRQAATVAKLNVLLGAAGASLTANQCLAGLYDTGGVRRGVTADQSSVWTSAGSKSMSLTSSYAAAAGKYYVALLCNGTTSPTFACGSTLGASFTPGNANLAAGSYRFCRSASGQTSLPTSITLSGYTPDANNVWVGTS